MENIYDFSNYNREVEIRYLESVLKQMHDEAITKSIEAYGPVYGHLMAPTKLHPYAAVYTARLEKLKRERLARAMEEVNIAYREFIRNV